MTAPSVRKALSAATEAEVVALAMARDDAAFEELVRRRQTMVRRLLGRVCGDRVLADDLAQETFVQAWRTLPSLHSRLAFGGWLRQVAVNVWLQHARRRRHLSSSLQDSEAELDTRAAAAPRTCGGEKVDLERGLARLRPAERLCVVLSLGEGLSHGEIAATTGWPLGTVKSHIARGAARLRALFLFEDEPHA